MGKPKHRSSRKIKKAHLAQIGLPKRPLRCYIVSGSTEEIEHEVEMCETLGWTVVDNLLRDKPDIFLYTGGVDIFPGLYGQKPTMHTQTPDKKRDAHETFVYAYTQQLAHRPVSIGLCRGAQLLNVLNGGDLYQHIDKHNNGVTHLIDTDIPDFKPVQVNSLHHQQMIYPCRENMRADPPRVIAWAIESEDHEAGPVSSTRIADKWTSKSGEHMDLEGLWYPDTKCFLYQPHPEYVASGGNTFDVFSKLLERHVFPVIKEQEAA